MVVRAVTFRTITIAFAFLTLACGAPKGATPHAGGNASPPKAPPVGPCPTGSKLILGGSFSRGSESVAVKDFCLDVHEATVREYRSCVSDGRCESPRVEAPFGCTTKWGGPELPANCITAKLAETYCRDGRGMRLPTADEWEWAARGRDKGWAYPWGDQALTDGLLKGVCWDRERPCPVMKSSLDVTSEGIYDLAGNLGEWTVEGTHYWRQGGAWLLAHGRKSTDRVEFHVPPLHMNHIMMGARCASDPN